MVTHLPIVEATDGAVLTHRSTRGSSSAHGRCPVHLRLLGGFELNAGPETSAPTPTGQQILAMLALRDRPTSRAFIAGSLWPDHSEAKAAGSLRSALWRLKSVRDDLIDCESSALSLGSCIDVDTWELVNESRRLLDSAPDTSPERIDIELFCRDLLPDWYDDWVFFERERLRLLRLASLERLAAQLLECGNYLGSIRAGMAAVGSEPLRESAHRVLISAHISTGNYSEAIRQYQNFAHVLERELALSPSPLMLELIAPLMRR